jgi:hypothetical protein
MIDLEPLQLGVLGCGLLIGLCLIGVRIAFAAAIVGTLGLVSVLGWSRGISAIGTIPYATTSAALPSPPSMPWPASRRFPVRTPQQRRCSPRSPSPRC